MKPEKVFEIARQYAYWPEQRENDFAFEPDDLMSFVVALLEEAHLEKAVREFHLDV